MKARRADAALFISLQDFWGAGVDVRLSTGGACQRQRAGTAQAQRTWRVRARQGWWRSSGWMPQLLLPVRAQFGARMWQSRLTEDEFFSGLGGPRLRS